MPSDFYPIQVLLLTLSAVVNRHQADVIAVGCKYSAEPQLVADAELASR